MTQDEIQKVQQALMIAEMFFLALPASTHTGSALSATLGEAIQTTLKYTEQ